MVSDLFAFSARRATMTVAEVLDVRSPHSGDGTLKYSVLKG